MKNKYRSCACNKCRRYIGRKDEFGEILINTPKGWVAVAICKECEKKKGEKNEQGNP